MTLAATVLVPTHDHGLTLLRSVRSALRQTVEELEVFVVGDGVPDETRDVMKALIASDARVRFFDNPKGARHGELHRHAALQEARGEIVCYLSDDDLWLPGHVAEMQALLAENDFAHAPTLSFHADGRPEQRRVDLSLEANRALLLAGDVGVPLSFAAHTLALYRRLPAGWHPAPEGTFTDLYMWQQVLSVPDCRVVSGKQPTVLNFPSSTRRDWSEEERLAELDGWFERLSDPTLPWELAQRGADALAVEIAQLDDEIAQLDDELRAAQANVVEADRDRSHLLDAIDRLTDALRIADEDRALLLSLRESDRLRGL